MGSIFKGQAVLNQLMPHNNLEDGIIKLNSGGSFTISHSFIKSFLGLRDSSSWPGHDSYLLHTYRGKHMSNPGLEET